MWGNLTLGLSSFGVAGILFVCWWLGWQDQRALYASGLPFLGLLWSCYFPLVAAVDLRAGKENHAAQLPPAKPQTPSNIPDPLWEAEAASPVKRAPNAFPSRYFETVPPGTEET